MISIFRCRNSNLLCYFSRQSKPFLRNITFLQKIRPKSSILTKTHHRVIYDFPYIKILAPFLKTQQLIPRLGVVISPFLLYLDETKISPAITLVAAGIYFLFGMAISKTSKNMVGKMYINKEGNVKDIMISSVDEFGRRVDRIHNVEDIINSDFPTTFARYLGFVRLVIDNSDMYYLLNISHCKFIDEKACDCILASCWKFYDIKEKENENKVKESEVKDNEKQLGA